MSEEKMLWVKHGYTLESTVTGIDPRDFDSLASPEITERLNKFASTVRAIAPRSDDFLYFSIIFLKAAESALIDQSGSNKKIGKEVAWGYFDKDWRWHGNVKPHKNNNGDIFPESELKIAARNWIGKPLCVDHKSESVDGVRGVILDTYYDEKLKQVVGLCALDKVNYPDLARKVETGVVRFGSMGTAVSTSICTECGKKASSPREYCDHINKRVAWGEINVGLKPIEYSLVVQPAEPGAMLLRCFASINKHKDELKSYGFNTETMLESLDENKANDLDILLNRVCGEDGCSIEQRQRIIRGYLNTNGFTKSAGIKTADYDRELLEDLARFEDVLGVKYTEDPETYHNFFGDKLKSLIGEQSSLPMGETLTSGQSASGAESLTSKDDGDVSDYTGTQSSGLVAGVSEPNPDSFSNEGDLIGRNVFSKQNEINTINSIAEEIMNESRLRRRAALRRRLAHPQGGSAPKAEPDTFKDEGSLNEKIREQDDKQMLQDKSMGGDTGMVPGDLEKKEKLSRAKEKASNDKRAYFHGAAHPQPEPATFTSEDYHKYWEMDKHMHQTKSMGGDKGMFPGDLEKKTHLKRAKYNGPKLSTKFKQKRALDGSINKEASCFEVYAGDKLVIAATAKDIFGNKLNDNWDWITSHDYAKRVIAEIRNNGLEFVGHQLTRRAQELPAMPEDPMAGLPAEPMGEELPALPEQPMALPEEPMAAEEEDVSPKQMVEDSLVLMEDNIEKIRSAISELAGGEDVDVNINIGEGEADAEKLSLSKDIFKQLKTVLAEAKDSADELALLSETYDRFRKLSAAQRKDLKDLSYDALRDFSSIIGQSNALISVANTVSKTLVKTSEYVEEQPVKVSRNTIKSTKASDVSSPLVSQAMELRKQRRRLIVRKAQEDLAKKKMESDAHDGIGLKENARLSGVTTDTAKDVALKTPKGGEHKPAGHAGHHEVNFGSAPKTDSQALAERKSPSMHNLADDDMEEVAEEAAEEEVEKHEEEMHSDKKESDASDQTLVQAKLSENLLKRKADEEREAYKIKLRRAYNVAMEMQRKGMLAPTKPALDRQVDDMMEFDDKAFEAFKRTVAAAKPMTIKTASDLTGLNIGSTEEEEQTKPSNFNLKSLDSLWD